MSFHLTLTVEGPERTVEGGYGPRTERDTRARIAVPIEGEHAWRILAWVVDQAGVGRAEMSVEEIEAHAARDRP